MAQCEPSKRVSSVTRYSRCLEKNEIQIVSEFDEIRRGSWISQDDSNGEVCFIIRDLEKKKFQPKLPFYPFSEKLNFLGFYIIYHKTIQITKLNKVENYYIGTKWGETKKRRSKNQKKKGAEVRNFVGVPLQNCYVFYLPFGLPFGFAALSSN